MKKTVAKILVLTLVICSIMAMFVGCKDNSNDPLNNFDKSKWEVAFFDDFKGNNVDLTKWKYGLMLKENNPELNGVRRASYYVDDQDIVFVKDGNLTIRTKYKDGKYGEGWYTGWLETSTSDRKAHAVAQSPDYQGFSSVGGYFEIRCQAPPSVGIWSAFWLMPDEGVAFTNDDIQDTATDGLEIDIMESPFYYIKQSKVIHVLHADGYDSRLKSSKSKDIRVKDMYSTMHTYALEWTKDEYIFYVDGKQTWRTNYVYNDITMGVSEVLQYMILSVEVGGHRNEQGQMIAGTEKDGSKSWAGDPNANDKSKNYDFVIDYIKVLKAK